MIYSPTKIKSLRYLGGRMRPLCDPSATHRFSTIHLLLQQQFTNSSSLRPLKNKNGRSILFLFFSLDLYQSIYALFWTQLSQLKR